MLIIAMEMYMQSLYFQLHKAIQELVQPHLIYLAITLAQMANHTPNREIGRKMTMITR